MRTEITTDQEISALKHDNARLMQIASDEATLVSKRDKEIAVLMERAADETIRAAAAEAKVARLWDAINNDPREEAMNAVSALQPGDRLPGGNVVVSLEPTDEQLQAAHDGPLMADEEHMDAKVKAWLREMYRAMIGATP